MNGRCSLRLGSSFSFSHRRNLLRHARLSGVPFFALACTMVNWNNLEMLSRIAILSLFIFFAGNLPAPAQSATGSAGADVFWNELSKLCGKAFSGSVAAAPADDTTFKDKTLVMHVRSCEDGRIRIPFFVGDDRSRTWVLTKQGDRILLKHDHRHKDGTPDKITMYGGQASNTGSAARQVFPADQETAELLPAAAGNIWWIELAPGEYFTYNLRRIGTDRYFSVRFDLNRAVPAPPAPWGWSDK